MISIFRDKSILAVFALALCMCLVHCHVFNSAIILHTYTNSGFIDWILQRYVTTFHSSFITIIYLVLIFIQAFRLNMVLNNSKMFAKTGFTIAFAYIILSGLFTNAFGLSAALIANSFLILLYQLILKLYNNNNAKGLIFNVGFLGSCAVIAYHPLIIVLAIVFFGLAILRPFKVVEWFILLLGIAAPIYLMLSTMYLCNYNFNQIIIPKILFYIKLKHQDNGYIINLIILTILMIAAFINWYPNSNRLVIQIRKNWVVMLILFLLALFTIPLFTKNSFLPELICLTPMAAFLANFFVYPKKTIIINILLLAAAVVIIYNNSLVWK